MEASQRGVSRRGLIGGSAAVAGAAGAFAFGRASTTSPERPAHLDRVYPFRGQHQAGITTAAQDRLHFAAFDVTTDSREALIELLKKWTVAAEQLCRGSEAGDSGALGGDPGLPPEDTGEAIGLSASGLTITIGFGPSLFGTPAADRFGLAARRPAALVDLPHFPGDQVDPQRSGGDLCVQACADDPQVAVHAIRNLARIGFGTVAMRWSQLGFGRTSSTTSDQRTPRNLFGFKDGTKNILAEQADDLTRHVWIQPGDDPAAEWAAQGSYLVARRINMTIEVWDRQPLVDQELFVGRTKGTGAPLSGGVEFDDPDFAMAGSDGPVMPVDAHVSVVHPEHNGGVRLLRRGYNFVDGTDRLGGLDAGLFFVAFVRDPRTHFIPMQTKMAKQDALMEYLKVTGSALFVVPPGLAEAAGPDQYVGAALFA
ncbi:MAG: iron uptake transporter deferrochelatase/peroxidase subunit [Nocardioides sp.]